MGRTHTQAREVKAEHWPSVHSALAPSHALLVADPPPASWRAAQFVALYAAGRWRPAPAAEFRSSAQRLGAHLAVLGSGARVSKRAAGASADDGPA